MKSLVLIVEDHPDIVEIVAYTLRREGFDVESSADGEEGYRRAISLQPALLLLDLMLPRKSGLEICRDLRGRGDTQRLPIVMLTAKGAEVDVVRGLEAGADDYVTKPFSPKELLARVRAVLRRTSDPGETLRCGELTIDPERHVVLLSGKPLTVTLAEFRILQALAAQPGRVLTRDQILTRMTGGDAVIVDRNVDVHISSLRRKLGESGRTIETVRGVGYRFAG